VTELTGSLVVCLLLVGFAPYARRRSHLNEAMTHVQTVA
jgi:hypothetical protein